MGLIHISFLLSLQLRIVYHICRRAVNWSKCAVTVGSTTESSPSTQTWPKYAGNLRPKNLTKLEVSVSRFLFHILSNFSKRHSTFLWCAADLNALERTCLIIIIAFYSYFYVKILRNVERTGAVGSASDFGLRDPWFDPHQGASSVMALSKPYFHSSIYVNMYYMFIVSCQKNNATELMFIVNTCKRV